MSVKKEQHKIKMRNFLAIDAQFRNSAGAMKTKKRKNELKETREFSKKWRQYTQQYDCDDDDAESEKNNFLKK